MIVTKHIHQMILLDGKSSKPIATALPELYTQHGPPKVIQHEQGSELEGALGSFVRSFELTKSKDTHIALSPRVKLNEHIIH